MKAILFIVLIISAVDISSCQTTSNQGAFNGLLSLINNSLLSLNQLPSNQSNSSPFQLLIFQGMLNNQSLFPSLPPIQPLEFNNSLPGINITLPTLPPLPSFNGSEFNNLFNNSLFNSSFGSLFNLTGFNFSKPAYNSSIMNQIFGNLTGLNFTSFKPFFNSSNFNGSCIFANSTKFNFSSIKPFIPGILNGSISFQNLSEIFVNLFNLTNQNSSSMMPMFNSSILNQMFGSINFLNQNFSSFKPIYNNTGSFGGLFNFTGFNYTKPMYNSSIFNQIFGNMSGLNGPILGLFNLTNQTIPPFILPGILNGSFFNSTQFQLLQQLLNISGKPIIPLRRVKRADTDMPLVRPRISTNIEVLDTFFKQFLGQINSQLGQTYQSIVQQTFQTVQNNVQSSVFQGKPFDINALIGDLTKNLQNTLITTIPKTLEEIFNTQSAKIIDDQFDMIKSILKAKLPGSFASGIVDNTINQVKSKLKEVIPNVTSMFSNEIINSIKNQLKIK